MAVTMTDWLDDLTKDVRPEAEALAEALGELAPTIRELSIRLYRLTAAVEKIDVEYPDDDEILAEVKDGVRIAISSRSRYLAARAATTLLLDHLYAAIGEPGGTPPDWHAEEQEKAGVGW